MASEFLSFLSTIKKIHLGRSRDFLTFSQAIADDSDIVEPLCLTSNTNSPASNFLHVPYPDHLDPIHSEISFEESEGLSRLTPSIGMIGKSDEKELPLPKENNSHQSRAQLDGRDSPRLSKKNSLQPTLSEGQTQHGNKRQTQFLEAPDPIPKKSRLVKSRTYFVEKSIAHLKSETSKQQDISKYISTQFQGILNVAYFIIRKHGFLINQLLSNHSMFFTLAEEVKNPKIFLLNSLVSFGFLPLFKSPLCPFLLTLSIFSLKLALSLLYSGFVAFRILL